MVNLLELFLKLENFYFVIHMKTKTLFLGMCLLITSGITAQQRTSFQIGDDGWALWLDRDASWKNDSLYLPPADISKITVAEPTCLDGIIFFRRFALNRKQGKLLKIRLYL